MTVPDLQGSIVETHSEEQAAQSIRRRIRQGVALTVAFHLVFLAWLLLRPFSPKVTSAGDDLLQTLGGFLAMAFCCLGLHFFHDRQAVQGRVRRITLLFSAAFFSYGIGQTVWMYNDIFRKTLSLPSWADVWFLPSYPLLLAGILLLPTQTMPLATRGRILLDSLVSMTALVTFSWYFILGPAMQQRYLSPLGKFVTVLYPLGDLVLLFALLWLQSRTMTTPMRRIVAVLSLGLLATIASDAYTSYESLHSSAIRISLLDMGWSLGYMPIGLAVSALPLLPASRARESNLPPQNVWLALLPYLLLPAFLGLVVVTLRSQISPALSRGVFLGGSLMVALVLLRQVLAILENSALNAQLSQSFREASASAEQMQQLNEELLATQEELHRNLTALTAANAQLEALATTDSMSGLLNHRGMVAAIDAEMERTQRTGRPCALLFLDIDRFKSLNDTHGHPAGDVALREIGAVLRGRLRTGDVVGRWGGEEFVALLSETDRAGALAAAEMVRAAVARKMLSVAGGLRVTCSIGVAVCPAHSQHPAGLVDAADRAMYAAKRQGRNRVCSADDAAALTLEAPLVHH